MQGHWIRQAGVTGESCPAHKIFYLVNLFLHHLFVRMKNIPFDHVRVIIP